MRKGFFRTAAVCAAATMMLALPVMAKNGREAGTAPDGRHDEIETISTETDTSYGESWSHSTNMDPDMTVGYSVSGSIGAGGGRSYGWSVGTSVPEDSSVTFGWLDTEGFHSMTSENFDTVDADNEEERNLGEKTGRVYGWLDENGFHPVEDLFDEDGSAKNQLREKMDEMLDSYNGIKAEIDRAKEEINSSHLLDELREDMEEADDETEDDEDFYDDEEDHYDEDEDDDDEEFHDDEEDEDFYSESLVSAINAIPEIEAVDAAGNGLYDDTQEDVQELIGNRDPDFVIVEEDTLETRNTGRSSSKGTVSGKGKSEGTGIRSSEGSSSTTSGMGRSEETGREKGQDSTRTSEESFSMTFGAGESEGTGTVKGRRIYYIYDLRDEE